VPRGCEIGVDSSRDTRILNLHGDGAARFQTGAMNLADRCSGERLFVKSRNIFLGALAKLIAHHFADKRVVHRR